MYMYIGVGYKLQAGWSTAMNVVIRQNGMQLASYYKGKVCASDMYT